MDIDQLAAVLLADQRLAALGYPRADGIAKSGSVELQTAFLAADVCRRAAELVEAVRGRLDALRAAVDANGAGIREIQACDATEKMRLAMARPAGYA
jgi:hypothetical protein